MAGSNKNPKVALITGASSGIGKAIAKQLLQDGLTVYVSARGIDKMTSLEELGARCLQMDMSVEEDIKRAVAEINEVHGGVDVLVNNAGFGCYGAVEDTPLDDARYQMEVNLYGPARLTQLLLPSMREKRAGKIVNISSMGGKVYTPLGAWYHASKHALEGWSDCLRLELAAFGIDVIVIEPGIIQTSFGDRLLKPMLDRSGSGVYANLAQNIASATKASYEKGGGSPPELIAEIVSKAVSNAKPKTRYVAGKFARPMLFIRKWMGDRVFDRLVMSTVK